MIYLHINATAYSNPKTDLIVYQRCVQASSNSVYFSLLPDHHQSPAAVLCPAGQELPVLLREGEDSECCAAASSSTLSSAALKRFESFGGPDEYLSCPLFNIYLLLSSSHPFFFFIGFVFPFPVCLSPALRADEQHPADEGAAGEDV